jgi:hypothetical protein
LTHLEHGAAWATAFGRNETSHRQKTASNMLLARSSSLTSGGNLWIYYGIETPFLHFLVKFCNLDLHS